MFFCWGFYQNRIIFVEMIRKFSWLGWSIYYRQSLFCSVCQLSDLTFYSTQCAHFSALLLFKSATGGAPEWLALSTVPFGSHRNIQNKKQSNKNDSFEIRNNGHRYFWMIFSLEINRAIIPANRTHTHTQVLHRCTRPCGRRSYRILTNCAHLRRQLA